ncbi:MAG: hypothetical protein OHK0022_09950 [Roseiflexaceae bacterium]
METVRQWMTSPAITALDTCTLPDARRLMSELRIRRLPVVDAYHRLVGIVTEGDINRISPEADTDVREHDLYHRVGDLPLRAIMTSPVISIEPDAPLALVARLLQLHRIGGLPVVENGRVIGVIAESDLFRFILATERAELERVNTVEVA